MLALSDDSGLEVEALDGAARSALRAVRRRAPGRRQEPAGTANRIGREFPRRVEMRVLFAPSLSRLRTGSSDQRRSAPRYYP